jgi:hypothetical protein
MLECLGLVFGVSEEGKKAIADKLMPDHAYEQQAFKHLALENASCRRAITVDCDIIRGL